MPEVRLLRDASLRELNTFGVEAQAAWLAEIASTEDLRTVLADERVRGLDRLVLGGGSNVLFVGDFGGLVLLNRVRGIEVLDRDERTVRVRAGAGEIWHPLVMRAVAEGWGGIENLALIPGLVGAAPIQNIGAYGVELREVFVALEAMALDTGEIRVFDAAACRFGYRDSVFKHEAKGRFAVLSVTLDLDLRRDVNTSYGAIRHTLAEMDVGEPGIADVAEAVIRIRSSKLPDPAEIGNAGSFFKNAELDAARAAELLEENPALPQYPLEDGRVKVPAGWLIERCGWKGKVVGRTGTHARQALVLVNHGGATGKDVRDLAFAIRDSVRERFGVELRPEVNMVGG